MTKNASCHHPEECPARGRVLPSWLASAVDRVTSRIILALGGAILGLTIYSVVSGNGDLALVAAALGGGTFALINLYLERHRR